MEHSSIFESEDLHHTEAVSNVSDNNDVLLSNDLLSGCTRVDPTDSPVPHSPHSLVRTPTFHNRSLVSHATVDQPNNARETRNIHLPQSLLVLVNAQVLRRLNTSFLHDLDHRLSYNTAVELMPFIETVGFISQRFLQTIFPAIKVFLESNTIPLVSSVMEQFCLLSSGINARTSSVRLFVRGLDSQFTINSAILNYSSKITCIVVDSCAKVDFLDRSSPYFLPNLKYLEINVSPYDNFDSFCKSLMTNSTVEELQMNVDCMSGVSVRTLAEVFVVNSNFRKVTLWSRNHQDSSVATDESRILINALASNRVIQAIDLSRLSPNDSTIIIPLLNNSTLKNLSFPSFALRNDVFLAIGNNSTLKSITLNKNSFDSNNLAEVLKSNTVIRKLELRECVCELIPIFKSLQSNTSLLQLSIRDTETTLYDEEVRSIVSLLQENATLVVVDIPGRNISLELLKTILQAVSANTVLKKVSFNTLSLSLDNLMAVYETLSMLSPRPIIYISSHIVNVKLSMFSYSPESRTQIRPQTVSNLESFLTDSGVKELTLTRCLFSFESIQALCELFRSNQFLTSVDLSNCRLSDASLMTITCAISSHSVLKRINLSINGFQLNSLLTIFELSSCGKIPSSVDVSPHLVRASDGTIRYDEQVTNTDLESLLRALERCIDIKLVETDGWKDFDLPGVMILYQILSINNSVIALKRIWFSIDVENAIFKYTPYSVVGCSVDHVSNLKTLIKCYNIKELCLGKCTPTDDANNALGIDDILKFCDSLKNLN
ncbi:hypothetical protein GEMRC1_003559 [Eukaryota sp. GEM-RC1]